MNKVIVLVSIVLSCFQLVAFSQKTDTLPPPKATKSAINFSKVIGWGDDGRTPQAPAGFTVQKYADGFQNPRNMCVLSDGSVLVAEGNSNFTLVEKAGAIIVGANRAEDLSKSADRIMLLQDSDQDGKVDKRDTLLTRENGLNQPFGMLMLGDWLYVANTNALVRFPFKVGQTKITETAQKILDLPTAKSFKENRHWTRNIIANAEGSKIYIAVGSGSNIGENGIEKEILRANILEINPDGSGMRVFASGLRNPVGIDYAPGTSTLWTTVNERDELGDDLVPDYLTSVVDGGFYGWPYSYWGQNPDTRVKAQSTDLVKKAIVPDVDLASHTASLGLLFYRGKSFPQKYQGGAFVAQHGSWNRKVLSGYKVIYVPFKDGKAIGKPEDFLTGFIADLEKEKVYGRPVGLAMLKDCSLLVTDDASNTIWRVSVAR